MKIPNKSPRTPKKSSLKTDYPPLIQSLREAARRYRGGVSGVSNHTGVSSNTLCNQLNINHESGDMTASTLTDLLFVFKNDPKFVDFFLRFVFEIGEGNHTEASTADILKTITKVSELISASSEAISDGEISKHEALELIDLIVAVVRDLDQLKEQLKVLGGE